MMRSGFESEARANTACGGNRGFDLFGAGRCDCTIVVEVNHADIGIPLQEVLHQGGIARVPLIEFTRDLKTRE